MSSRNFKVLEKLKVLLSTNFALYVKTQNYHWNVVGNNFMALHELFEEHYQDLAASNDVIAERIRALDSKVPASLKIFASNSEIAEGDENNSATEMVNELIADNEKMIAILKAIVISASEIEDKATEDLAIERISQHEKNVWMLKSIIQ